MRKKSFGISLFLAVLIFCLLAPTRIPAKELYWPEVIEIETPNAIIMEESTGTILFEKNIEEAHYPASITKIMTAIIALENGNMSDTVVFSKDAVYKTEGSGIARDVDEEMTLEQCMYAMLLESANECAYAIAEHVGGTYDNFIRMMNEKAEELGCINTHFTNPHGLPDEDHYTCCYDMALISREAWKNETFRIMTGTIRYEIPPTNKHKDITYLQNHNAMLNNYKTAEYLYEPCVGGKTGYTIAAGNTLVTYAQKNQMTLICVVMNTTAPLHWTESEALFEHCFENFGLMNIRENETRFSSTSASSGELNTGLPFADLSEKENVVLPLTAEFDDTEPEVVSGSDGEDQLGEIVYHYADHVVGKTAILAMHPAIEPYPFQVVLEPGENFVPEVQEESTEEKSPFGFPTGLLIIILVAAAVILVVVFLLVKFSPKFYLVREKYYRWKNQKNPYRTIHTQSRGPRFRGRRRR